MDVPFHKQSPASVACGNLVGDIILRVGTALEEIKPEAIRMTGIVCDVYGALRGNEHKTTFFRDSRFSGNDTTAWGISVQQFSQPNLRHSPMTGWGPLGWLQVENPQQGLRELETKLITAMAAAAGVDEKLLAARVGSSDATGKAARETLTEAHLAAIGPVGTA